MSYDGPLWAPPAGVQSAGKKPAMVEEYLCETLEFFVLGGKEYLEQLWERVVGRVSPFAKKSVLQFPYEGVPNISALSPATASATTQSLGALPMIELGSMPKQAHPYLMPVRSKAERKRSGGYEVMWSHVNCVWESGLMVREGTPVIGNSFSRFENLLSELEGMDYGREEVLLDATGEMTPIRLGMALVAMTRGEEMVHQMMPQVSVSGRWKWDESREVEVAPMGKPLVAPEARAEPARHRGV